MGESKGIDSNLPSRSGLFAAVDCSPRGFRTGYWTVYELETRGEYPGPCKGTLKRRSIPAHEDRMFFPTLIMEDKDEERRLLKRSRKTKVKYLQDAQRKYYRDKEEAESEETEEDIKPTPTPKKEVKQDEKDGNGERKDGETAEEVESIRGMMRVIVIVDDDFEQMGQLTRSTSLTKVMTTSAESLSQP